ncbi:putative reverse transcriptase domain-containing protein [Tanacetum coccineum]
MLCNPILALPEGKAKIFITYCTLSKKGLGAVLDAIREKDFSSYASRQLKIHEKNYTTHDLELEFATHLRSKRVEHKGNSMFRGLLIDYEFDIRYHPGKANGPLLMLLEQERMKLNR